MFTKLIPSVKNVAKMFVAALAAVQYKVQKLFFTNDAPTTTLIMLFRKLTQTGTIM